MRVFADYMRRRGSAQHAYWRQKSTKHVLRICCAVYEEERGEIHDVKRISCLHTLESFGCFSLNRFS
jgi:hypothetical protein